jgi:hypothetical protein
MLVLDLPEMFLSADVLKQTTFSFYTMSPSVSAKAAVSIQTLSVLSNGATLLATSSGTSLVPVLFPGTK